MSQGRVYTLLKLDNDFSTDLSGQPECGIIHFSYKYWINIILNDTTISAHNYGALILDPNGNQVGVG